PRALARVGDLASDPRAPPLDGQVAPGRRELARALGLAGETRRERGEVIVLHPLVGGGHAGERGERGLYAILGEQVARRSEQVARARRAAVGDEVEEAAVLCGEPVVEDAQLRPEPVRARVD